MGLGKKGKPTATVSTIQTDYVRTLKEKEHRRKVQKIGLRRRLTVFAIAAVIILSILTHTFVNQNQVLAKKEEEKKALLVQLEEVKNEQQTLTRQIAKLSDDEYIAKLARQEYFLSDKNEIIFSLPKTVDKDEKKADSKE